MSDPDTIIAHFNRAEALVWFVVAVWLPFVVRSESRKQQLGVYAGSIGFVLFGISDLLEAGRAGDIPAWLWVLKISCGAFLLSCRILYVGLENFRLNDRWLLFGLFCLAVTVALILFG